MFTQKKKAYYSKILGFKTIEDFEIFSKRYLKYLENQTLTKNRIMTGFFILIEIQKESLKNNICGKQNFLDNLSKGIDYSFTYKDKNSELISTIIITKSDCK